MKTITPFKTQETVVLNMKRLFSKVLIVRINEDFDFRSKLIERAKLPRCGSDRLVLRWDDVRDA